MIAEAGEHPFAGLVRERGGVALDPAGGGELPPDEGEFVAILARGEDILPPVARLGPALAPAWLVLTAGPAPGRAAAAAASELASRLGAGESPAYLLTAGRVGGPAGEPHSVPIEPELVARVLDAAAAGTVDWEADPDFGYELPMDLPELGVDDRRLLVPRFLYARTDRVYDYAAVVPACQRERAALLASVPGLGPAVARARGIGLPERRSPVPPAGRGERPRRPSDG